MVIYALLEYYLKEEEKNFQTLLDRLWKQKSDISELPEDDSLDLEQAPKSTDQLLNSNFVNMNMVGSDHTGSAAKGVSKLRIVGYIIVVVVSIGCIGAALRVYGEKRKRRQRS